LFDLGTPFRAREPDPAVALLMCVWCRCCMQSQPPAAALALLGKIHTRSELRMVSEPLTPRPASGVAWEPPGLAATPGAAVAEAAVRAAAQGVAGEPAPLAARQGAAEGIAGAAPAPCIQTSRSEH
jgi:hypothetical protein